MSNIEINDRVHKVHPQYNLSTASKEGMVLNIVKQKPMKGSETYTGYSLCLVRKHAQNGTKTYSVHCFVWECFNRIPDGKVIDHINNGITDNRLCNLQLMTQQQNCKKTAKNHHYSYLMRKNKKLVKAVNCTNNEVTYYDSLCATEKHLHVNKRSTQRASDGLTKTCT